MNRLTYLNMWKQTIKEKFCWAYSLAHYFQLTVGGVFSPYGIVIAYYRYKGFKNPLNRSQSIPEVFEVLKNSGITFKKYHIKKKYYPQSIERHNGPVKLPILALLNNSHAIVVIKQAEPLKSKKRWVIIDSLSKDGNKVVFEENLSDFYTIR